MEPLWLHCLLGNCPLPTGHLLKKNFCKIVYDGWVWNLEATGWRHRDLGPNLSLSKHFFVQESGIGHHFFGSDPKRVFVAGNPYWISRDYYYGPSLVEHKGDELGSDLKERTIISFLRSLSHDPLIEVPYFDYDSRQVKNGHIEFETKGMKAVVHEFARCLRYD